MRYSWCATSTFIRSFFFGRGGGTLSVTLFGGGTLSAALLSPLQKPVPNMGFWAGGGGGGGTKGGFPSRSSLTLIAIPDRWEGQN